MKMAYNGSQAVVDVPDAGLHGVRRGEPVEIEDQSVRGMLRRQDWSYVENDDENDNDETEGSN